MSSKLGPKLSEGRTGIIYQRVEGETMLGRIAFRTMGRLYLNRYFRYSPYARRDLRDWFLPVAAARLEEGIPHEVEPLLVYVRELAAQT